MIQRLLSYFSPERKRKNLEESEQWTAWKVKSNEASARYEAVYEQIKDEKPDLSLLSDDIKQKLVSLFAEDNYHIRLYVGGNRGLNADMYFMWKSGTTTTVFQEKDYGTDTFIRMCKAAEAYAARLVEKRGTALRNLVDSEQ